jgi:hypothetical protein
MWIALFTIAIGLAVGLSVAAIALQSAEERGSARG